MKILLWSVIYFPNFLSRVNQTWLKYLLTQVIAELPPGEQPLTGVLWMDYRCVEIWSPPPLPPPPSPPLREARWGLGWQKPLNQLPLAVSPVCHLNRFIFHVHLVKGQEEPVTALRYHLEIPAGPPALCSLWCSSSYMSGDCHCFLLSFLFHLLSYFMQAC